MGLGHVSIPSKFENAAELGRIGKYYAVEDMLTTEPDQKFGTMTSTGTLQQDCG
jgi:divinyl chlorophyllide a 8-vinyl-reductase